MRKRRSVGLARALLPGAALAVCLASADARAELCPAPTGGTPALADVDSQVRLAYLAHAFDREVHDIDVWSLTWGSLYTAGAIAEGVGLAYSHNHGSRADLTVGIISTAFGAVSLYGLPLELTLPLRGARRHWSEPDPCAVLARAEKTLVSVEKDQATANGIVAHLGNIAVNAGIVLILGLGYDRWPSAALSGGVGVVVGEANAFTQPHHLREVLAHYRSGTLDGPDAPPLSVSWSVAPVVSPQMAGLALVGSW